jgi:hypothetical protein
MSRKSKLQQRAPGGEYEQTIEDFFDGPALAQQRAAITTPERIVRAILKTEVDRLSAALAGPVADDAERLITHLFAPTAGAEAASDFLTHFRRRPPMVVLNYPRTTAEPPVYAIVLSDENESDNALADHVGESLDGEDGPAAEYRGAHFEGTISVFVFAEHPDVTLYLYQLAKAILFGAKPVMERAGLLEIHFSGGDLSPDESYIPESMFARVLRVSCKYLVSVPVLVPDPARFSITGAWLTDVVVEGVRGGVSAVSTTEDDDVDDDEDSE